VKVIADKNSWPNIKDPEGLIEQNIDISISELHFEECKYGFIPRDMDDRWFIYMENETIYFYRSWSGICFFILKFNKYGSEYKTTSAWCKLDSPDKNKEVILRLINNCLIQG